MKKKLPRFHLIFRFEKATVRRQSMLMRGSKVGNSNDFQTSIQ